MSCVVLSPHHGAPAQTPCSTAALCALPDTADWRHGGGSVAVGIRIHDTVPFWTFNIEVLYHLESSDFENSINEKKQNVTGVPAPTR